MPDVIPEVIPQRYEEAVTLDRLVLHPANPNESDIGLLHELLAANGFAGAVMAQESTGIIFDGNHRLITAQQNGMPTLPVIWCDIDDDTRDRFLASFNESTRRGRNDEVKLIALLQGLAVTPKGLEGTAFDGDDLDTLIAHLNFRPDGDDPADGDTGERPSLADRFLIPPFDVLDARQGWWRTRKQQWLSLGFASEEGRDGGLVRHGKACRDAAYYAKKAAIEQRLRRDITAAEFEADHYEVPEDGVSAGTSIFDPVLCELAYRWFSPPGGLVLDPFAGGSVRGLVGAILGRRYTGNDLSELQVKANIGQGEKFKQRGLITESPLWSAGDSAAWTQTLEAESADMIFTCPPYYSLEVYSDDPADLSAMTYEAFDSAYARIMAGAAAALHRDRFAVVAVGDARDPKGALHDLRGSTIRAAEAAGLAYVNGAVLITPVGSIRVVAARAFVATRVLGRTHQDILVFCKGNRSAAAEACGDVDLHLPDEVTDAFSEEPAAS